MSQRVCVVTMSQANKRRRLQNTDDECEQSMPIADFCKDPSLRRSRF